MKRTLLAAAALMLAAGAVIADPQHKPAAAKTPVCPVMQHEIGPVNNKTPRSVYKGKTYYFCCDDCKPAFDKNPAAYVKEQKPARDKKKT